MPGAVRESFLRRKLPLGGYKRVIVEVHLLGRCKWRAVMMFTLVPHWIAKDSNEALR